MLNPCQARLTGCLMLAALSVLLLPRVAPGQEVKKSGVTIKTLDGVDLSANVYPSPGAKRDAVVILLHDIDMVKGTASEQEGWTDLALALQKDGYVVVTFDFRGFGESKSVDKDKFWKARQNLPNSGHFSKGFNKDSIDYKNFKSSYLQYLVNDIAAVKAFLDRRNDAKALNSSNTILIGAGEGATLGAMFLAHEARRARDKNTTLVGPPVVGDPEIKDYAAAIWLSISPQVGSKSVQLQMLSRWLAEVGRNHKVPMAFIYGKNEKGGGKFSEDLRKAVAPGGKVGSNTGAHGVATALKGQGLLSKDLKTSEWIVDTYLKNLMKERNSREQFERKADAHRYVFTEGGKVSKINKPVGQEIGEVSIEYLFSRPPAKLSSN